MEAETGVIGSQAKEHLSHQKLEDSRKDSQGNTVISDFWSPEL